jgi:hypothetical protein
LNRPADILAQLREHALPALAEMARWKSQHGQTAFVLQGRMVGLRNKEILETWDHGERESIIAKAAPPAMWMKSPCLSTDWTSIFKFQVLR